MRITDHRIDAPGGRLFARAWHPDAAEAAEGVADGPALLLLHDSLGCVALWRDLPERLARETGRPVVAYDRLGFGLSDRHPGRLDPDFVRAEAETIALVRGALGLGAVIPLGHSVGGGMALAFAAQHPDACAAVVTLAAQVFIEEHTLDGIRAARETFRDPAQVERLARYHGDKTAWVLDAWIGTWLSPAHAGFSLDAELRRLARPLLALYGDRDEYVSLRQPERVEALCGERARVVVIKGCGHLIHREHPDAVVRETACLLAPGGFTA